MSRSCKARPKQEQLRAQQTRYAMKSKQRDIAALVFIEIEKARPKSTSNAESTM